MFLSLGRGRIARKLLELIAFLFSIILRNLVKLVFSSRIFPCSFSDHDFFFVNLGNNCDNISPRGYSIWKFNSDLLSDQDFVRLIKSVIASRTLLISTFADGSGSFILKCFRG